MIYSMVLSGRSGLVAVFLFMPVIGVYFFLQAKVTQKLLTIIKYFAAILAVILAFQWIYQNVVSDFGKNAQRAFSRSFETFEKYQETGKMEDRTLNALSDMWIFPEDPIHFLFGNPYTISTSGVRSFKTDIGYVRYIDGYGIFGSLLFYTFYLYAMAYLYKKRKIYKDWAFLTGLLLFVIMFFQMKEIFVFTKTGFSITSIMLISFILYVKTSKRKLLEA